jgi:TP901 family phage tail tape measure protein
MPELATEWVTILPETTQLVKELKNFDKTEVDVGVNQKGLKGSLNKAKSTITSDLGVAGKKGGQAAGEGVEGGLKGRLKGVASKFGSKFSGDLGGAIKNNIGKIAGPLGALASTAAASLYAIGRSFDDMNAQIRTSTGATGEQLEGLSKVARDVAKKIPVSFGDAGKAVAVLTKSTGASGDELENLTAQIARASRVAGVDMGQLATGFSKNMKQWGINADEGAKSLDQLYSLTTKFSVDLPTLNRQLSVYGSVLNNAGFSMGESATLFAKLEDSGIAVSRIMPGLNKSVRTWASENKDAKVELAGVVDSIKNTKSPMEALALATDVFGAEGAQRLTTAIRNGSFALDDLSGALEGAEGSLDSADKDTRTFAESWQMIKNTLLDAVYPAASKVFGLIADGSKWVADFVQRNSALMSILKPLGVVLAGMGGAIAAVAAATKAWAAVQAVLNIALSANLIGLIVIAIAGLVAGIIYAYKHFEGFRNVVDATWKGIVAAFKWGWGLIKGIWDAFTGAISWVIDYVKNNWKKLIPMILGPIGVVVSQVMIHWDTIKEGAKKVWEFVKEQFNKLINFLKGLPGQIASIAANLWDGLKSAFKSVLNSIIDLWNSFAGKFKFDIPSWVPGLGGKQFGLPTIPNLQQGGYIRGPGTGTSDSIVAANTAGIPVARVSNGEGIVKASVLKTRWGRALFELLNRLPAFKGGGVPGGGLTPHALMIRQMIQSAWPQITNIGGYHPEDGFNEHSTGNALDVMIPNPMSKEGVALGNAVAGWALKNANALGLDWAIWRQHIYKSGESLMTGGRQMEDRGGPTANHFDHVHLFLNKGVGQGVTASFTKADMQLASSVAPGGGTGFFGGGNRVGGPGIGTGISQTGIGGTGVGQNIEWLQQNLAQIQSRVSELESRKARGEFVEESSLTQARLDLERARSNLAKAQADQARAGKSGGAGFQPGGGSGMAGSPSDADWSSVGGTIMGGMLETLGLQGDVFSNPFEWPTVKSAMAGINFVAGLVKSVAKSNDPMARTGSPGFSADALTGGGGGDLSSIGDMLPGVADFLPQQHGPQQGAAPGPVFDMSNSQFGWSPADFEQKQQEMTASVNRRQMSMGPVP